jgi:hypothetical protein
MRRRPVLQWTVADKRHLDVGAVALPGLVEQLLISEPTPRDGATAPGSGTATARDALRAVAELTRAIEVPAEAGDLDPEQAHRMASLLLVIRDALDPLGPATPDRVRRFLGEFVQTLRR